MKKQSIYLLFLFTLFSCSGNQQQAENQIGHKLKSLSELGMVEYVVSKVVKADDNATWYKFGDRKILFTCKANLKAGLDLSELSSENINIDARKKSISIVLPKAKLLSINMKPDDVHLVYEKTAITRFPFSNAERDMIMAQGEKDIKENVSDLGILADAEKNAKIFLEAFLAQAGFTTINIQFANN